MTRREWILTAAAPPLGRGDRYRDAVRRGLEAIVVESAKPASFAELPADFLFCFHVLSTNCADPVVSKRAQQAGRAAARAWQKSQPVNRSAIKALSPGALYQLADTSYAASCLGVDQRGRLELLKQAARAIPPQRFFGFDPIAGDPRTVPGNLYDTFCDALITAFVSEHYVPFGASLAQITRWAPLLRPYRWEGEEEFIAVSYAITHLVYVLNGYGAAQLDPAWLPAEHQFLLAHFARVRASQDVETLSEYMDCLRTFGHSLEEPILSEAAAFLLRSQNPDGSWGQSSETDPYVRFHSTWTALGALMDYRWPVQLSPSQSPALRAAIGKESSAQCVHSGQNPLS